MPPGKKKKANAQPIELNCAGLQVLVRNTSHLDEEAKYWSFAVAQRDWWGRADRRRAEMDELARATMVDVLGVTPSELRELGDALADELLLEVVVPEQAEFSGARRLPWEYLLMASTTPRETRLPPTIVRCVHSGDPLAGSTARRRVLYVESLPGEFEEHYTFNTERQLPGHLEPAEEWELYNPSLAELRSEIQRLQPDVIHLAGLDSHHACALQGRAPSSVEDGAVVADGYGVAVHAGARDLARALCAGRRKPALVVFNLYNSASDLGAETTLAGAGAALGFQHSVDDSVAELFLAEFSKATRSSDTGGARTATRTSLTRCCCLPIPTRISIRTTAVPRSRDEAPSGPERPLSSTRGSTTSRFTGASSTSSSTDSSWSLSKLPGSPD